MEDMTFSTRRLGNAWKRHQKRRGKSGGSWLEKMFVGGRGSRNVGVDYVIEEEAKGGGEIRCREENSSGEVDGED